MKDPPQNRSTPSSASLGSGCGAAFHECRRVNLAVGLDVPLQKVQHRAAVINEERAGIRSCLRGGESASSTAIEPPIASAGEALSADA